MDHMTANKSQAWANQMDWSAVSMQSPLLNNAQSGRDPLPPYSQPGDSFLRPLPSMLHIHSHVSPASLFASTPFDPPQPMDAREKLGSLQTGHQAQMVTTCAPPSCMPSSSTQPSFQSASSSGSYQCSEVFAAHNQTSTPPPVASQWIDSVHCRALNDSDHPNKDASVPTPGVTKRSMILRQRSLLLQQLSELDKLLESLPPEDDASEKSPHSAAQSHPPTDESPPGQSETAQKIEPEWCASSEGPSPASSPPPPPASNDERRKEDDDDDDLTEDSASAEDATELEKRSADSSDDGSVFDDSDVSDAFSDFEEDIKPPSSGSTRSPSMSPCSEKKPRLVSLDNEPRDAETEWSRLKNVKVCAMKQGQKSCKQLPRRNYCLFCSKPLIKMSRHLEHKHSHKEEVSAALRFPKGSQERQKAWNQLINEGNYVHNKRVLRTGEGQLAARKRPRKTGQAQDFLHCLHCRGLYVKKNLACHIKRCPERKKKKKDDEARSAGKARVETRRALETMGDPGVSAGFRAVLSQMIYDDVTRLIISEPVLLSYGEDMLARHAAADGKRQAYVRQSLREMARLVLEARERTPPLRRLEDFFIPDSFPHVAAAVNVLAGYAAAERTYAAPSVAIKLGYSLQKVCRIVQERALERRDFHRAESAKNFLVVHRKQWAKMISSDALSVLRKNKRRSLETAPDVQDVKRLIFHVEKVYRLAQEKFRDDPSAGTYDTLARVILAQIVLFNRRQTSEVSSLPFSALKSIKKPDPWENSDLLVGELERRMCRVFSRLEIRAKCGRMVPILLKPDFLSTLDLLAGAREACGVPAKNAFLFGRPHMLGVHRGSTCLRMLVKGGGIRKPETLTSAGIRKHHAAMLQLVSLDPIEAELILGPNNQVKSLRENIDAELEDIGLDHEGLNAAPSQCGGVPTFASWEPSESFSGLSGMHVTNSKASQRPPKVGSPISKHKWSGSEVAAVERHMMSLIRDHKVPQKRDCVRCLEAEPRALATRSWKGVKDYVRNRITALKRQAKPSK
ncbi:uncharacterized protein LOC144018956 [Festucalex cinctus]